MVFQGEATVLSKDVIKISKDFVKTWVEWSADNEIQVLVTGLNLSAITNLFTVPNRQTLFITSCYIDAIYNGGAMTSVPLLQIIGSGQTLIATSILNGAASHSFNSLPFPMPIKVEEKNIVRAIASANHRVSTGFQGFLVRKKIA